MRINIRLSSNAGVFPLQLNVYADNVIVSVLDLGAL